MPELPEVEAVKNTLRQLIIGKKVENVSVTYPKLIKKPDDVQQFQTMLQGEIIEEIGRRGKFLLLYTTNYTLVSHLRMEGKYRLFDATEEKAKHTHVVFRFTDGTELRYQDVRKFGTMHLFQKGDEKISHPLIELGPEPLSPNLTVSYLQEILQKSHRKIKVILLDQHVLVGLGNIYVDEVLYRSRIHPEREAASLLEEEIQTLYQEIVHTLSEAIAKGGSTIRTYVNSQGKIGTFQQQLLVYGHEGEPCNVCGSIIMKTVVGGRGTHYCAVCQQKEKD
ncbi:DNA-formamidopyrimidine glycosylase [Ectobacillus sp. sgz5001026]|uniref:DNA-formamidopyrimidine glycosylase n=1 Tax=Ectobacillus sp. sgz5001026 TaxID=3242473 RepID=UPI0036D42DA5